MYAYVANNPTSWVDPSGHDAQTSVLSAIQMLPPLSANAALLGVALGSLIKTTLIIGRSAASWTLDRQHTTEKLVLGVFGLVLACGRIESYMTGMRHYSNLAGQAGSDALAGVTAWTASQLQDVASLWPYPPTVARPQTSQLNLGGLNSPLGPWLQACMLGGVLSGVANLTADAYGYQGTPTQNATIAANVMYNVVTCGVAGGGSSGGSSNSGSKGTTHRSLISPQRLQHILYGDTTGEGKNMVVGHPDDFAIEWEIVKSVDEWVLGHIRFWVQGKEVGDWDDLVDLKGCHNWLHSFAGTPQNRFEEALLLTTIILTVTQCVVHV